MSETNKTRQAAGQAARPAGARRAAPGGAAARTAAKARAGRGKRPGTGFDAGALLSGAGARAGRIGAGIRRLAAALAARIRGRRRAPGRKAPAKRGSLLKSRFYRIYFALLGLAAILIVVGCVWLNGWMKDYESAQPIHVAEEVAKVFEERDFDHLYHLDSSAQDISQGDPDVYTSIMRGVTDGKDIAWSEAFSGSEDEKRYTVTVGGDRFASFTLVPSGERTARGNRLWKLSGVDTHVVTEAELDETLGERIEYRVTVPETWTVTVDGAQLTAQDAEKTGIDIVPEGFLPKDVKAVKLTQYAFESRNASPAVAAVDDTGAAQTLREDGKNAWIGGPVDNADFREKNFKAITKLAEEMAKFTANDISQSKMLVNVVNDSPAFTLIKRFSNSWAPTHKYAEFANMAVSDCIFWSKSCFTCRVTFDFTLRTRRGTEQTYPTAYTFCIVRRGDKAKIYNLQMN